MLSIFDSAFVYKKITRRGVGNITLCYMPSSPLIEPVLAHQQVLGTPAYFFYRYIKPTILNLKAQYTPQMIKIAQAGI